MMSTPFYFITGNVGKLREMQLIFPDLNNRNLDLPEMQQTDPQVVLEAKLVEALRLSPQQQESILIEDTGLYLEALGGLPGPLIKWFIAPDKLGLAGLYQLAERQGNLKAEARTVLGYARRYSEGLELRYFTGSVQGQLLSPRGSQGFGWDAIFSPEDTGRTFAEMSTDEKLMWSMRRRAGEKLKIFLENN